jgi:hypothetical protein
LLPLVFCIYVILQLPLHYNAKNNVRTVNDLSDSEWKGRRTFRQGTPREERIGKC